MLVDVREPNEYEINQIPGSVLIPKGEFLNGNALEQLPARDKQIVMHCKTGRPLGRDAGDRQGRRLRRRRARRRRRGGLGQPDRPQPAVVLTAPASACAVPLVGAVSDGHACPGSRDGAELLECAQHVPCPRAWPLRRHGHRRAPPCVRTLAAAVAKPRTATRRRADVRAGRHREDPPGHDDVHRRRPVHRELRLHRRRRHDLRRLRRALRRHRRGDRHQRLRRPVAPARHQGRPSTRAARWSTKAPGSAPAPSSTAAG